MPKMSIYVPQDLWEMMVEEENWSAVFQAAVREKLGDDAPMGTLASRVAALEGRLADISEFLAQKMVRALSGEEAQGE